MSAKVCVIHPGAIGDLVLALPVGQTLADRAGPVTLFATGSRAELFAGRSAFAAGQSLDNLPLAGLFCENASPASAELFGCFERIVCGYPSPTLLANLRRLCHGRIDALDVRPASIVASGLHASDFLHRQLFDSPAPLPRIDALDSRPNRADRPTLLVHPGSGGAGKCWPLACFRQVAEMLASAGWRVEFVIGPAEVERWRGAGPGYVLPPTPAELARAIASADCYLGNDSGPTHIAAALGRPTVALFGPTNPRVWGPRGRAVRIMAGDPAAGDDWAVSPADVAERIINISQATSCD